MSEEKPKRVTLSGNPPAHENVQGAPDIVDLKTGMHKDYWILSEEERKKGFIRPVRRSYVHLKCGNVTKMNQAIAETYARDPHFYTATFCCYCMAHYAVGENGEFEWLDRLPNQPAEKVGT